MKWFESPRGYTGMIDESTRCTIFFNSYNKTWKYVIDGRYSPDFPSLSRAIDSVEKRYEVVTDRRFVVDEDPEVRNARRRQQQQRANGWRWRSRRRDDDDIDEEWTASSGRYRPPWAVTLELEGDGPWALDQVRDAFRRLAKIHHPDVGGDAKMFQIMHSAWERAQTELDEPPF